MLLEVGSYCERLFPTLAWLLFRWAGGGICARFGDVRMSGRCAHHRLVRGLLAAEAIKALKYPALING